MLPASAEVVVIGGGVMGVSIAFHLAEAGVSVVLLERGDLGGGSTSKAAGGVRTQFSDELNIALGARSLEAFASFADRPGQEIDLRRAGYLFLLTRAEDVAAFEASVALQNAAGLPTRMITPDEASELSPLASMDGVLAASFSPQDGYCSPESVVLGYATGARRLGARLLTGVEVLGIDAAAGTVATSAGVIEAGALVCAAGAWSASVGEMAGVDLPVVPLRRQVLVTESLPGLAAYVPMTIDFETSFYFHGEGEGVLLGMSDPDETPGFKLGLSDEWMPRLTAAMTRRAPGLLDAGIRTGWAGLYEVSPDHNALIGSNLGGWFLYATGFSGHGFLQAPAVGEVIRDLHLGRRPFIDPAPFSARRFAASGVRPEHNTV